MWLLLVLPLASADEPRRHIELTVGHSVVFDTPRVPTAVSITDSNVAVAATLHFCCRIYALRPGTTDILVQYGRGELFQLIDLTVVPDVGRLQRAVDGLATTGRIPEPAVVEASPGRVRLPLGATVDLDLGRPFTTARVTAPGICTMITAAGSHLQLLGARLGETDLAIEFGEEVVMVDLVVERDLGGLQELIGDIAD